MLTGSVLILISIFFHIKEKNRLSIILLFAGTLSIYLFATLLDPFLNLWDERFHALVAKNLMEHPLMPTLFDDPVVDTGYDNWDRFHIWLHKPPLFLWQIAISFKIFGVNEFALRLPSAILSSFLIIISYRTGKLLINSRVGYYTAFLFSTSFFMVELISGRRELDHNTITFLVYVSASIWSWVEYLHSKKWYWVVIIGIFSGFAILCKWLTGLLVYLGWGIYNLINFRFILKKYKPFIISLFITFIVVLPWQVLIFWWYPAEAKNSYQFFSKHLWEVLDGHSGNFWYHFDAISLLYGKIVPFIIIIGFILLFRKINGKGKKIALISLPVVVFLFFSITKTKMENYTFFISMIIFLSLACIIDYIIGKIRKKIKSDLSQSLIIFVFLGIIGAAGLNIELIQKKHTFWNRDNSFTKMSIHNKSVFIELRNELPGNAVIFNIKGRHYIESMFYTGLPSYNIIPTQYQYYDLKDKGKKIVIFRTENSDIPEFLLNDSTVLIIAKKIYRYD